MAGQGIIVGYLNHLNIFSRLRLTQFQRLIYALPRIIITEKKLLSDTVVINLKEEDLEEDFVKGSGPGGQKINKTSSCVILKHLPTGITVKCQKHRSQERNRKEARGILTDRLDLLYNKENSKIALEKQRLKKLGADYVRKRKRKEINKEAALAEREKMLALLKRSDPTEEA